MKTRGKKVIQVVCAQDFSFACDWNCLAETNKAFPCRCCLDSTIRCIKHCVCLVTHLGHLHRCASFLYHVHYCTHWILLDFELFWKQATHSLSSSAQRIMASIIFLFFKLAPILVKRRQLWILHFRECFIFLFAQKVSFLFFYLNIFKIL